MAERVEAPDHRLPTPAEVSLGIIGGTGALGMGLALRFAPIVHTVLLGSRTVDRARAAAPSIGGRTVGVANADACSADYVVVAVPWSAHDELLTELSQRLAGRVVIDAVNPLAFDEQGAFAVAVDAGSATQRAQQLLPDSAVVGAFHHVPAGKLRSTDELDADVFVVGDDRTAVSAVCWLIDAVPGLCAVHAGRLRDAGQVEALTANLIAINRRYRTQAGLRVTGIERP